MSSIYEVNKLATSGPWKAADCGSVETDYGYHSHRVFSLTDAAVAPVNAYGEFATESRANAQIVAHYHNTYMKALAALKTNLLCSFCPFCGRDNSMSKKGCTSDDCPGVKLIKELEEVLKEIQGIADGGGFGSILGRNAFQRPKADAIKLLAAIQDIYRKAK